MAVGGVVCAAGIFITLATYAEAAGGGEFVVAWGAVLSGGIVFLRGLARSVRGGTHLAKDDK